MILSHYTSKAGLDAIAKSAELRATNFLALNDKSEYIYAWEELQSAAFDYVIERVPSDLIRSDLDYRSIAKEISQQVIDKTKGSSGYGELYVTSFAHSVTRDHVSNGILTLWDRYTQLKGYCLQYRRSDLEQVVRLDADKRCYAWASVAPVSYGVDRTSKDFGRLAMQVGEAMLVEVLRRTGDPRIQLKAEGLWATSYLAQMLMQFCGTHKHPAFEDEREFRLLLYPADQTEARILTGLAMKKSINHDAAGKKYIMIGDDWRPGIEPFRIIIGPQADPDIESILKLFSWRPEVSICQIPICSSRC